MGKRNVKVRQLRRRISALQKQMPEDDFHVIYGLALVALATPDAQVRCLQIAEKFEQGGMLFEILKDLHHAESLWVPTISGNTFQRMTENWKHYRNSKELTPDFIFQIFSMLTKKQSHWRGNIPPERKLP